VRCCACVDREFGEAILIIVGIDCGQTGAVAVYDGMMRAVYDMPTSTRLHGSGQQVNGGELASIMMGIKNEFGGIFQVKIEAVSAMPGNGGSSMFRFGESVGVVLGVCGALQLPIHYVTPQRWKKNAGLIGKDKDAARTLVIQQHPEISDMLTRKKDIGRADACCVAKFG